MNKKIIGIRKSTQKQTITAIKSGDFSEVDKIRELSKKDARQVFNVVASGSIPLIWYDLPPVRCQSGAVSVMRYALHRSPQKADYLQLSCMENPLRAALVRDLYKTFTAMLFICLLTAYICIMVYFTVYGCKVVSGQFYAIN